jgi:transposase
VLAGQHGNPDQPVVARWVRCDGSTHLGHIECVVVAPSLIPVRPGDRIKTDRRDAAKLARLLRSGDLAAVWVPDEAGEALGDLVRARDDAKTDQLRARHRLSKFLLRRAIHPPVGVRAWGRAHDAWLDKLTFAQVADQVVFEDYRSVARAAAERVKRLAGALLRTAGEGPQAELVRALQAIRGIGFLSAVTIAAEAGDLRRFPTARQFMAYVGLVPSEWSSGPTRHRGRITKTGNRLVRHVLGQAAHNARYRPNVSSGLRARQRLVPREIVELDRKAQARLHHRYRSLVSRIGVNKTVIAVARELAGFVWAAGQHVTPAA